MKTSKTFTILFWQNLAKNKGDSAPLYARITVDGKRAEMSLGILFPIDAWNGKMNRANGKTREARILNEDLDGIYTDLTDCYKQLKKEGRFVTAQAVKARYLGTDHSNETLLGLSKYHFDKNRFKLAPGTLKNYSTTETYLQNFLVKKFKATDIPLEYIQYSFVVDFELYLRNPKNHLSRAQPLKNNGIMKHIERLNKLMGFAEKLGWIAKHPFEKYQLSYTKFKNGFLTKKQLQSLETIELNNLKLARVRDVFVFCCYTGLSYIDVKLLTDQNLVMGIDGNMWLSLYREKSDDHSNHDH